MASHRLPAGLICALLLATGVRMSPGGRSQSGEPAKGWEPAVRLSSGSLPAYKTFPCQTPLAVGTDGAVHAVWYEVQLPEKKSLVYYRRSLTAGATWEEPQLLSNSGYYEGWTDSANPSVAVSGARVHVLWQDARDGNGEVYCRRSEDGGVTWLDEVRLTRAEEKSVQPSVAVSGDTIHLVWGDFRDGLPGPEVEIYYKRSEDGGKSWSDDLRLTWSCLPKGAVAIACAGRNVLVFWMDARDGNWEIYYARSEDAGTTWSRDTRLTENAGVSEVPVVAIAGDVVHVAWTENTLADGSAGTVDDYEERYVRSTDGGLTWSEVMVLTDAPKISADPSIAVAGDPVHLAWSDRRDSEEEDPRAPDREVYYKSSADGGLTWSNDLRLTFEPAFSTIPSVAASPSAVHVLWVDEMEGTPQVLYRRNTLLAPGAPRSVHFLAQNYPNPFNPGTRIPYKIADTEGAGVNVRITIYDIRGRVVRTLFEKSTPPGSYEAYWDGLTEEGAPVPSGVYFFRMQVGGFASTRRMVLQR